MKKENNHTFAVALKISIGCFFATLILSLFVLYVLLVQIDSVAGVTHRIEALEAKLQKVEEKLSKRNID